MSAQLSVDDDVISGVSLLQRGTRRHSKFSMQTPSDSKLKLGSLVFSYVLGFSIEMTSLFVKSSNYFIFIVVTGIMVTLLQSWVILLQLRWGVTTHLPCYSLVDFLLWFEASILCFHSGFFCAWAISDYMYGSQTQVVSHAVREMMCVAMCVLCTRSVDLDRFQQPYHHPVSQQPQGSQGSSDRKLKLGSMTLSYILGYSTHMTAVLVMLTHHSSFICQCLLVTASVVATILQSWITSMHFDWERSPTWELLLWLVASVLSSLSGFFCAWIVTDYWLGFRGRVIDHVLLEVLFVSKFLLLTWGMCYEDRISAYVTSCLNEPDEDDFVDSEYYHQMIDSNHLLQAEVC